MRSTQAGGGPSDPAAEMVRFLYTAERWQLSRRNTTINGREHLELASPNSPFPPRCANKQVCPQALSGWELGHALVFPRSTEGEAEGTE
ncbi:hypothetical protein MTO96_004285 [Rhipicephalus appendiculatus]